jgi:class 3 adenylate cyclase/uncharacterized membrane protein affecting hemolysin expression
MIFPLRLKLALLTITLLVAGIGTVAALLFNQYSNALETEAKKRGRYIAQSLAQTAREAVLLEDDVGLAKLVETVAKESEVIVARLLDADGQVLASTFEDDPASTERMTLNSDFEFDTRGRGLVVASRMSWGEVDMGEAQVVLDLYSIVGAVIERSRRDLYVASGGLLVIGVLIAFSLSGRITQPLRRLRIAVNALAKGDTTARVEVSTRDEVADLARAFNEMSSSLSEKRRVETAFRRYVSDHVLQQVLDQPDAVAVAGERRDITVLFIDIRRFTQLASAIDPEPLVGFLNEAFELITDRLLEHGATIDKYLGDAILAYFGAPIEADDHPERGVAAAIAVQRSVEERNKEHDSTGRPFYRLEVGVGIQTGPVVLGNIGSELKMDYTIIGDAVNVANRLQKLARSGEILVTGDVASQLGDRVSLQTMGIRALEGREEPVEVFQVLY